MVNLDDTRALQRIAHALERIADCDQIKPETAELTAEPVGGVPIWLIVDVLCALIRLARTWKISKADKEILTRKLHRLEPYLPEAPVKVCLDGEEAE